jgi:hypothetical protein
VIVDAVFPQLVQGSGVGHGLCKSLTVSCLPDSFVQEGQQVFCATLRVNSHNRSEVSSDVWFSVSRRLGVATTVMNAHELYIPVCAHFWGRLN